MSEIRFYDPRDPETGFLSNFYSAPFQSDGVSWPTVEHFYQALKFTNEARIQQILVSPSPKEAKRLGRLTDVPLRADWEQVKLWGMLTGVIAKFLDGTDQSHQLLIRILNTDNVVLIEASPTDSYWGEGADGQGCNHLGRILMALRCVLPTCDHENLQGLAGEGFDVEVVADRYGNRDAGLYQLRDRCMAAAWALLHDGSWDPTYKAPGIQVSVMWGPIIGQGYKQMREALRPLMGCTIESAWSVDNYSYPELVLQSAQTTLAHGLQISVQISRRFGYLRHETVRVSHAPKDWAEPRKPTLPVRPLRDLLATHAASMPQQVAGQVRSWRLVAAYVMKTPAEDDILKRQYSQPACEALSLEFESTNGGCFIAFFGKHDEGFAPTVLVDSKQLPSPYGTPWELLLTTPQRGALPLLEDAFAKRFVEWGIELGPRLVVARTPRFEPDDGCDGLSMWSLDCVFGRDERGEFLDYVGSHRHYGEGSERIYEDGTVETRDATLELEELHERMHPVAVIEEPIPTVPKNQSVKQALGIIIIVVGAYIGFVVIETDPRPAAAMVFAGVIVVIGAVVAWRPDSIK